MEWLKALLKDVPEADKISEAIQKELPKHFKPAEVFNEVNNELKATKEQLAGTTKTLEELSSKGTSTADEYKAKLDKLTLEHTEFVKNADKRVDEVKKGHLLQSALLEAGADKSAVDLLAGTIDLNTIELVEGKIKGFEDMLKPIREARPTLFRTEDVAGAQTNKGKGDGDTTPDNSALRDIMGLPKV